MKCILLCAGYATRLYPLTINFPKALLDINGVPLINYTIAGLDEIEEISDIYVVTNDKFYDFFVTWQQRLRTNKPVNIVNDNTTSNDNRLGAIGDVLHVIRKERIDEDLLVIAGDNLFAFSLKSVVEFFQKKRKTVICAKTISDIETLKRYGVAQLGENGEIINIEEKPQEPKSDIGLDAVYVYPKEVLNYFSVYQEEGHNMDAPGHFPAYLCNTRQEPVYAFMYNGTCYDVGTHETLRDVRTAYVKKPVTNTCPK